MTTSGLSKERLARMHDVMAGYVERGELPGLVTLVSRRGEAHVDAIGTLAFDGDELMQRDTIFRIASMTKPIAAAAAMILVEECTLRLDDPVDELLPELTGMSVLASIDSPLDDTVPAKRSITLRDLLTFQLGTGAVMAPPGQYPIQRAIEEAGLDPGPNMPTIPPGEWLSRLGSLPLLHQPGEGWHYHTGSEVLSVLIARAAGQPLGAFLRERIFEPLGMCDTSFQVPTEKLDRLPTSYEADPKNGGLRVHDDPDDSRWGRAPAFPSGGGGLVSTVDDYLTFCQMMLNMGKLGETRILSRPSVELMTTNHLTPEQQAAVFGSGRGWGFGVSVTTQRIDLGDSIGNYGWSGGIGTTFFVNPTEQMIGILMTQRLMDSPTFPDSYLDFFTSAYQAIDD